MKIKIFTTNITIFTMNSIIYWFITIITSFFKIYLFILFYCYNLHFIYSFQFLKIATQLKEFHQTILEALVKILQIFSSDSETCTLASDALCTLFSFPGFCCNYYLFIYLFIIVHFKHH